MATNEIPTAEAARRLGVSPRRVRALHSTGQLRGRLVTPSVLVFDAAAVAAYQPKPGGWPKGRPRKVIPPGP